MSRCSKQLLHALFYVSFHSNCNTTIVLPVARKQVPCFTKYRRLCLELLLTFYRNTISIDAAFELCVILLWQVRKLIRFELEIKMSRKKKKKKKTSAIYESCVLLFKHNVWSFIVVLTFASDKRGMSKSPRTTVLKCLWLSSKR